MKHITGFEILREYDLDETEMILKKGNLVVHDAVCRVFLFSQIKHLSYVQLIAIVNGACDEARTKGFKRVCLFDTLFSMQGGSMMKSLLKAIFQ